MCQVLRDLCQPAAESTLIKAVPPLLMQSLGQASMTLRSQIQSGQAVKVYPKVLSVLVKVQKGN